MATGKTYDLRQYQEAGRELGLGARTIQTIADSADSTSRYMRTIRTQSAVRCW